MPKVSRKKVDNRYMRNELKKSGATNFVVEKTSQWREKIPLFVGCTQDNISLFG